MFHKLLLLLLGTTGFFAARSQNLAVVASPTGIDRYGGDYHELNDEQLPREPGDPAERGRKPKRFSTWVQYNWAEPVSTNQIEVYWWDYSGTVPLPSAYRIEYWDGSAFRPVQHANGLGLKNDHYNPTHFDAVRTTRLRLEMDSADRWVAALLEWKVLEAPGGGPVAPKVVAGVDRDVMLDGKTYLTGRIRSIDPVSGCRWSIVSGPGEVRFSAPELVENVRRIWRAGHLCPPIDGYTGIADFCCYRTGKSRPATAGQTARCGLYHCLQNRQPLME